MDYMWIIRPVSLGSTTLIVVLILAVMCGGLGVLTDYVVKNMSVIIFIFFIMSIVLSNIIFIKQKDVISGVLLFFAFSQGILFVWAGLFLVKYEPNSFDKELMFTYTLVYSVLNLYVILDICIDCLKNHCNEYDIGYKRFCLGCIGVFGWIINYMFFVL